MKMPKTDRYKIISLITSDEEAARERAIDQDADIRFRIKHDVPVFNRPETTHPEDRVFTNITGKPTKTLYNSLIADLLKEANLREGTQGVPRLTYCFRHTYATLCF